MKKWIDDHMGWIVSIGMTLLLIVIMYFVSINICWTCTPTNITSGDFIV